MTTPSSGTPTAVEKGHFSQSVETSSLRINEVPCTNPQATWSCPCFNFIKTINGHPMISVRDALFSCDYNADE